MHITETDSGFIESKTRVDWKTVWAHRSFRKSGGPYFKQARRGTAQRARKSAYFLERTVAETRLPSGADMATRCIDALLPTTITTTINKFLMTFHFPPSLQESKPRTRVFNCLIWASIAARRSGGKAPPSQAAPRGSISL